MMGSGSTSTAFRNAVLTPKPAGAWCLLSCQRQAKMNGQGKARLNGQGPAGTRNNFDVAN
jgi:hypothetical protein